jgi:hypothetical protein
MSGAGPLRMLQRAPAPPSCLPCDTRASAFRAAALWPEPGFYPPAYDQHIIDIQLDIGFSDLYDALRPTHSPWLPVQKPVASAIPGASTALANHRPEFPA